MVVNNQPSDTERTAGSALKISTRASVFSKPELHTPVKTVSANSNKSFDFDKSPSPLPDQRESGQKRPRESPNDNVISQETSPEVLYCHCRRPDDGKFMIQCESCENWFHGRCVGMNREKSKRYPNWRCAECIDSGKATRRNPAADKQRQNDSKIGIRSIFYYHCKFIETYYFKSL